MSTPLVYLILGAAGSGRLEVIADLIRFGLDPEDRPQLFVAQGEIDESKALPGEPVPLTQWSMVEGTMQIQAVSGTTHLFVLSDGSANPVDQVEALRNALAVSPYALGRIITVVNGGLLAANPSLVPWYDACIHFSDVVLLNRREGLSSGWVAAFNIRLRQNSLPCHVELVRKGRVANPALVLYPEPRRISLVFDGEEHLYPDGDDISDEEAVTKMEDPYFERLVSGRRVREIIDINRFLDAKGS